MKKRALLLTLALALSLSGCSAVAAVGCAYPGSSECSDGVLDAAWEVDEAIFDAVFGSDGNYDGPQFNEVSVEGVVTSGGTPLYQARVDMSLGSELWTVRTDRSGRYQVRGVVKPSRCSEVHLTFRHPDQRTTDPLPVKCGEQQQDYDFPLGR